MTQGQEVGREKRRKEIAWLEISNEAEGRVEAIFSYFYLIFNQICPFVLFWTQSAFRLHTWIRILNLGLVSLKKKSRNVVFSAGTE